MSDYNLNFPFGAMIILAIIGLVAIAGLVVWALIWSFTHISIGIL